MARSATRHCAGLDRIVMILAGAEKTARSNFHFPKPRRRPDMMVDAPTPVSEAQLRGIWGIKKDSEGEVWKCGR